MNEILKERLQILASNELLIIALKELFNEGLEKRKPYIESLENNELLGARYRAYEEARGIVEQLFIDLASHKLLKTDSKPFNKER